MRSNTKAQPKDIGDLANNARALMEATANVTGQAVERARKRLALALKHGTTTGADWVEASADRATDKIHELRDGITVALNHGKAIYENVHDDVVRRTQAANQTVHENPYRAMGVALGVGAVVGFVISARHPRNGH